ncbi:hypothetical protein SS05631_c30120 [Sinorhizobium sp. CCBAU 05631]|nr:hypothetical protein SS05631_c30120 [Sinorhizobium sp. CCBAU 05631]
MQRTALIANELPSALLAPRVGRGLLAALRDVDKIVRESFQPPYSRGFRRAPPDVAETSGYSRQEI